MRKSILFIGFGCALMSQPVIAADQKKAACIKILGAGMYNGVLEEVCEFSGGVKNKLLNMYNEAGCRAIVPQKVVDRTAVDVLKDTKARYKAMGRVAFCKGNIEAYNALQDR